MYPAVIDFWFAELEPKQWWIKDDALDQSIIGRFSPLHQQAVLCELFGWRANPLGRLAEIIVLDQFSRNMYRDTASAFAADAQALALAQEAIATGAHEVLTAEQRSFLYMPFMHSESAIIHQQAVELFNVVGMENNYEFELKHKVIIDRFGRYPHRNDILGRSSSPEEVEFLTQPGSSF